MVSGFGTLFESGEVMRRWRRDELLHRTRLRLQHVSASNSWSRGNNQLDETASARNACASCSTV